MSEYLLLSMAGTIITIIVSIASLAYWLGRKFAWIDAKFREIDLRFQEIDRRFQEIDKRFQEIDRRFQAVDERFQKIEERLQRVESKLLEFEKRFEEIDRRFQEMERKFEERFKEIDKRFEEVDRRFERMERKIDEVKEELRREFRETLRQNTSYIISTIRSLHCHLIDFMSMKGLFTQQEREYLIREAERLISIQTIKLNPLKPEEAKFILEVLKEIREKDPKEIDLSKLDRIMEIADRWFREDGCYEAAKLWIIIYTLKRILEKERGEL